MNPRTSSRGADGSESFVRSLFRRVEREFTPDASLPPVVVQNRLERAQGRINKALASSGLPKPTPELRARVESLVSQWAGRSFDDGFQPVEQLEIECARERDLMEAEASRDPERVFDVLEKRFRRHVIEQYGSIELRGIQVSHRVILDLDEVYVPLHVIESVQIKEQLPDHQAGYRRSRSIGHSQDAAAQGVGAWAVLARIVSLK